MTFCKKKDKDSKLPCGISSKGNVFLRDLDDPICWTWMLYAGCVLSFSVTIRIPRAVPAGAELSFGGAAAPIQPTYTLIRIFGATGTRQPGHTHNPWYCSRKVFNGDYSSEKRIWSTSEAAAWPRWHFVKPIKEKYNNPSFSHKTVSPSNLCIITATLSCQGGSQNWQNCPQTNAQLTKEGPLKKLNISYASLTVVSSQAEIMRY